MEDLYTATFAAKIHAIAPSDDELTEVKASLKDLRGLLPSDINPEDDPDILFVAGNLAVAGEVNLNDDGIDIPTALAVYKRFEKKQVNIEHNRGQIVGFIIRAGLSDIHTDKLLTEDEARGRNGPFNISTVAALWRVANKDLCSYIEAASQPGHPDYGQLSLSWEMGFKDYSIVSIPKGDVDIAHASKVIRRGDGDFETYTKALRAYKGTGSDPQQDGNKLYRIMPESVIPLGQGVVTVPAAAVKGVLAITKPSELPPRTGSVVGEDVDYAEKKQKDTIISARTSVSTSIDNLIKLLNIPMNKAQELNQIKDRVAKADKVEDFKEAFAGASAIAEAIMVKSEELTKNLEEEKNRGNEIQKARDEAKAAAEQLTAEVEALKKELDTIKATQLAEAAQTAFDARMAALDAEFELDDDTRAFLISEIKACENDEVFAKKMDQLKKVMKEKTKAYKKDQADKAKQKSDEMCAALAAKGVKVTVDAETLDFKEIFASAQENVTSTPVHNTVETKTVSLADQAKEAFAAMTIGGKKLGDLTKKE